MMGEAKSRGTQEEREDEAIMERLRTIAKSEFATAEEREDARALIDMIEGQPDLWDDVAHVAGRVLDEQRA